MPDLQHTFGADIGVSATGDLALSDGTRLGQERVLRRLLTNPGDYIWQPAYGAGLAGFIGQPAAPAAIEAVTRAQMLLEAVVARDPAPVVSVAASPDGTVTESIRYADAATGATQTLTLPIA